MDEPRELAEPELNGGTLFARKTDRKEQPMDIAHAEPALFTWNDHPFIHVPSGFSEDLVLHLARNGFLSRLSCFAEYDQLDLEGAADAAVVQAVLKRWRN
jgi:hypothetical protein